MDSGAIVSETAATREVAFVHDSRLHDGMLQNVRDGLGALQGSPYRARVYTCLDPSLESEYPQLGTIVRGHRLPFGGDLERGVNRWLPVFAHRLRDLQADVIHLWSVALAAMARDHPRVVITIPDLAKLSTRFYGRVPSHLHNRLLRYVPRASAVTCQTEWVRHDIVQRLRLPEGRVFVVPPWFPLTGDRGAPTEGWAPPTPDAPWSVLAVAVDRPHKNLGFFLRVLARLDARFRGLVVSRPSARTLALTRQLGLSGRVTFVHDVPDLAPIYRSARLLLHPSLYEGFGLPLIEAMAAGLPVVASDRTSVPEVVGDGGVVLPPNDPSRWAEAVEAMTDPRSYQAAVRRGRARAAVFNVERSRAALLATYGAVVG